MDETFEHRVFASLDVKTRGLDTAQGNILGRVFAEVLHYRRVVQRVLRRYQTLNDEYLAIHDRLEASLSKLGEGSSPLTDEQQGLFGQSKERGDELRQEIETFYMFSRILLDKMTQAFVACFGPGTGEQTSHRRFIAKIDAYLSEKKLAPIPRDMKDLMKEFETSIIDFRDHAVVHAKSLGGMRHFFWNRSRRETYLVYDRLYPRESDQPIDGLPPPELMQAIEEYMNLWLSYLERNWFGAST